MSMNWTDAARVLPASSEHGVALCAFHDRLYLLYRSLPKDLEGPNDQSDYPQLHTTWYAGDDADWARNTMRVRDSDSTHAEDFRWPDTNSLVAYASRLWLTFKELPPSSGSGFNFAFGIGVSDDGVRWDLGKLGASNPMTLWLTTTWATLCGWGDTMYCAFPDKEDGRLQLFGSPDLRDDIPSNEYLLAAAHYSTIQIPECYTDTGMAIAAYQGRLRIAYKERGGSGIRVLSPQVDRNAAWDPARDIPLEQQTSHAPALAVHAGALYLAYKDDKNARIWVTKTRDGREWEDAQEVSGQYTSRDVALASYRDRLYLAYNGEHGNNIWVTSCT